MAAQQTLYTFKCTNFVSNDAAQKPSKPCPGCKTEIISDLDNVVNLSANHLIQNHGYMDNKQLRIDILNCLI